MVNSAPLGVEDPQKSVRKNCQYSQISGMKNSVERAGADIEVVGELLDVPSDSVKV
jgi:hypothetical protein